MSRIYEIFGTNAHAMTRALMESAGAACKIPSGASVALKPNLVVAASPETGATTHAGVLSGAIEYLRDHGFRDISIIEGSWVGDDTGRAFRAAGYEAVGKKYGVPLFDLKRDKTRRVDTPLRPMDICCRALDADYLINLPVLKGHCQTAMTCALKNCKGCLPDREKRRFHAEGKSKRKTDFETPYVLSLYLLLKLANHRNDIKVLKQIIAIFEQALLISINLEEVLTNAELSNQDYMSA